LGQHRLQQKKVILDWRWGSSSGIPALPAGSPEFNFPIPPKTKPPPLPKKNGYTASTRAEDDEIQNPGALILFLMCLSPCLGATVFFPPAVWFFRDRWPLSGSHKKAVII
jgi:hypothetical protein